MTFSALNGRKLILNWTDLTSFFLVYSKWNVTWGDWFPRDEHHRGWHHPVATGRIRGRQPLPFPPQRLYSCRLRTSSGPGEQDCGCSRWVNAVICIWKLHLCFWSPVFGHRHTYSTCGEKHKIKNKQARWRSQHIITFVQEKREASLPPLSRNNASWTFPIIACYLVAFETVM